MAAAHFERPQPDRDRRLQPPADRRHHRGGHGHRRRAREVRGLRLGRGRDRRPRHGRDRRGARAQPHAATARPRSSARPRRAAASPSWRTASASTASRRRQEQAEQAMEELEATLAASRPRRCGEALMASELIDAAEPQTEPIATRQAYGDALVALGEAHEDVVALDADLAVSTQSMKFGKQFPERFFNVGAAEANMMSMACGLAATGKVPYASTFAIFATVALLRPGPARHRPQRAQGPDRRLARRRLARRGRRLAPDDRGHRADAGDAEDAGGRPGRLQPGLHAR